MNRVDGPTADDLLQRREELREQGIAIGVEELCRDAADDVRDEVVARLGRIEAAERAVEASWGWDGAATAAPFFPSGRSGRYADPRVKAEGGMGVLCVARDVELGRSVAYKVMLPGLGHDAAARSRFFHEAEITSRLNHPGIVPVYGRVTDDSGLPAYASAYVTGRTLASRIEDYRAIDLAARATRKEALASLLDAFVTTCEIVAHAHSRSIVHGDIKPLNILTDDYDATLLVDWGLARVIDNDIDDEDGDEYTQVGVGVAGRRPGTWPFLSSFDTPATFASDVHALGMTLAFILADPRSGLPPRARPAPDSPLALWAVTRKALNADRALRYDSASALASDVKDVMADRAITAYLDPSSTRLRRFAAQHRTAVATTAVILVVAATAGPLVSAREHGLRLVADTERNRAIALTREMLDQADHVGSLQATLPGSRALLDRAVRMIEQLARDGEAAGADPGPAADDYYRAGRLHQKFGQLREAAACYRKAADLSERRGRAHPDDAENRNRWASALREWGVIRVLRGGSHDAGEAWARAIELVSPVADRSPSYRLTLGRLHYAIGNQNLLGGRQADAQASFESARTILSKAVAATPDEPRAIKALSDVFYNLGLSLSHQAIPDGTTLADPALLGRSRDAHAEALRLRRRLATLEPGRPESLADVAASLNQLGRVARAEGPGGYATATDAYRQSRAILEALVAAYPGVFVQRQELARVNSYLSLLLAEQGRPAQSREAAATAVELQDRLVADQPDSPGPLADLGFALEQQARALRLCGDPRASLVAGYEAARSFARAASFTSDASRREALAARSVSILNDLKGRGFFRDERRVAELSRAPEFSKLKDRRDFPRP